MVFFFKFFRYIHEIFQKKNRIGLGRELKIWKLATTTVLIKVVIEDASLSTIFQREVKINTRFNWTTHKSITLGATRVLVIDHNSLKDFTILLKMLPQGLTLCLPSETSYENLLIEKLTKLVPVSAKLKIKPRIACLPWCRWCPQRENSSNGNLSSSWRRIRTPSRGPGGETPWKSSSKGSARKTRGLKGIWRNLEKRKGALVRRCDGKKRRIFPRDAIMRWMISEENKKEKVAGRKSI
jgi:hypothetical protein